MHECVHMCVCVWGVFEYLCIGMENVRYNSLGAFHLVLPNITS